MIDYTMSDETYHSRPELSSTGARLLLPEFSGSPAKFIWDKTHPRTSKAYDIGHAVHARVLGTGLEAIAYPESLLAANGAASTKAAKEWAEEQRTNGFVPMKSVEVNVIRKISEAVLAHPEARKLLEQPHRETSIITTSPEGVPIRARYDIYGPTHAGDLKTTTDPSPRAFNRHVLEYGYYVQEAFYRDAHHFETGQQLDTFKFIAAQTTGPYLVAVHELDLFYQDIGQKMARRAREIYQECTETGVWPGIDGELLTPPNWLINANDEEMTF